MRKIIYSLLPIVFILFTVAAVNAQTSSTSAVSPSDSTILDKRSIAQAKMQEIILQKRMAASAAANLKREEFKSNLKSIRDLKKQALVEKIDNKISTVNQNRTDKFANVLDKLQAILDRISQKATVVKTNGANTATLDIAITNAQQAINTAKTAVTNQAAKQYVIQLSTTSTASAQLKNIVGSTVSQFRQDLNSTHKAVVDARQSVHTAAKELAKLTNAKGIFKPSGSATNAAKNATGGAETE